MCAKAKEISTALDTCGYVRWENLENVLTYTDLVLYDLKHMDPEAHKDYTGVTNELILENARRIARKGVPMHVRVPVIPQINDSLENLRKTAEFVAELNEKAGVIKVVDLLPYHPYAGAKYRVFGLDYPFPLGEGYPDEKLEQYVELFTDQGLDITVGG